MSIDWFRWHHGSISDPKFTVIARKSKQPRSLVLAVWAALLETASQADDRGSLEGVEIDTIAACLDVEEDAVSAIYQAAVDKGLIADGRIASWDRRQVYREDDDSKDRVRRFREKQKQSQEKYQENDQSIAPVTQGNAPVTQGNAPVTPQITDTDTDQNREEQIRTEKSVSPAQARPARPPSRKTACPSDLSITPELQAWADQHGYIEPMAAHLDNFRDKSIAKGYRYADWNAALRNAIRDDWAGLRKPPPIERAAPGGGRRPGDKREATMARNGDALSAWLGDSVSVSVVQPKEITHATH